MWEDEKSEGFFGVDLFDLFYLGSGDYFLFVIWFAGTLREDLLDFLGNFGGFL